jgi:hypothetical protein
MNALAILSLVVALWLAALIAGPVLAVIASAVAIMADPVSVVPR